MISWGVLPIEAAAGCLAAEVVGIRGVFMIGALTSVVLLVAFVALISPTDLSGEPEPPA